MRTSPDVKVMTASAGGLGKIGGTLVALRAGTVPSLALPLGVVLTNWLVGSGVPRFK